MEGVLSLFRGAAHNLTPLHSLDGASMDRLCRVEGAVLLALHSLHNLHNING